jgi:hypothetical protein
VILTLYICEGSIPHAASVRRPGMGGKEDRCFFCPAVVREVEVEASARGLLEAPLFPPEYP